MCILQTLLPQTRNSPCQSYSMTLIKTSAIKIWELLNDSTVLFRNLGRFWLLIVTYNAATSESNYRMESAALLKTCTSGQGPAYISSIDPLGSGKLK